MADGDYTLFCRGSLIGLNAEGAHDDATFQHGTVELFIDAVVIVPTLADISAGTRSPTPPFEGYLDRDFGSGSIVIHDTNDVILMPATGPFNLGDGGKVAFVDTAQGAFDNFSVWKDDLGAYIGKDPALLTYTKADTQGTSSAGQGDPWSRHYRVFIPPRNARYLVPAAQFKAVPTTKKQYLDAVQTELLPLAATTPTAFVQARQINVTVNPTRLNYSLNPSLRIDATHWSTSGSGSRDTAQFNSDTASYKVTGSTTSTTVSHTATDLIAGVTYIASVYVRDPFTTLWSGRESDTQVADADGNATFTWSSPFAGTVYWDDCLIERGTVVKDFFHGDSGDDYLWEQGGTDGAARSYFYEDRTERHYVLVRLLGENVPLGVPVGSPEYALRPPLS